MSEPSNRDRTAGCGRASCERDADFWLYHPEDDRWQPYCERHTRQRHPSLEVNAWLESGYARPAELGTPDGPPATPPDDRTAAFRDLVDRAMDWSG